MVTKVSAQITTPITTEQTIPKLCITPLTYDLTQRVINFFKLKEVVTQLRLIRKAWKDATRDDGNLDVRSTKIRFVLFNKLIGNHATNGHSIRSIHLGYCRELDGDRVLAALRPMTSLTKLRLPCNTSNEGMSFLKEFRSPLKHLNLESCDEVNDDGLIELGQTQFRLEFLSLQGCPISPRGIESIFKFPLTSLNLGCCFRLNDEALRLLIDCPLTKLKLSMCQKVTDLGMGYISGHRLTLLWLSNCCLVTDEGFQHLDKMPLKYLRLDNTAISNKKLLSLELLSLQDLDIGKCRKISEVGLQGLGRFPLLNTLSLRGFNCLNQVVITTLCELNLTSLSISGTNIDNALLDKLSQAPMLRELQIRCCYGLQEGFGNILLQFRALTKLEVTESDYTGKRNYIAFPIGIYFQQIIGEEIETSRVSKPVEKVYDTILEYLEKRYVYS